MRVWRQGENRKLVIGSQRLRLWSVGFGSYTSGT